MAVLLQLAVHVEHVQPAVLQCSPSLYYLIEINECHTPAKEAQLHNISKQFFYACLIGFFLLDLPLSATHYLC